MGLVRVEAKYDVSESIMGRKNATIGLGRVLANYELRVRWIKQEISGTIQGQG